MISKHYAFLMFNILGLEVTWAACAYGATHELVYLGFWVGIVYVTIHFLISKQRLRDLFVVLFIGGAGVLLDISNSLVSIISFEDSHTSIFLLPYWLISLWAVFSLLLPYSLSWLTKNLPLAAVLGAIGGGFSYWLGERLGAIQLQDPILLSTTIYTIQWGIFTVIAFLLLRRINAVLTNSI